MPSHLLGSGFRTFACPSLFVSVCRCAVRRQTGTSIPNLNSPRNGPGLGFRGLGFRGVQVLLTHGFRPTQTSRYSCRWFQVCRNIIRDGDFENPMKKGPVKLLLNRKPQNFACNLKTPSNRPSSRTPVNPKTHNHQTTADHDRGVLKSSQETPRPLQVQTPGSPELKSSGPSHHLFEGASLHHANLKPYILCSGPKS